MHVFKSDIDCGEFVYLITDPDQHRRIVTGVMFAMGGGTLYRLTCGAEETFHFKQEISREPAQSFLFGTIHSS